MIDAVNSILEEEKKQQQLDEASTFDWKSNKNETDPKFTTKKSGERTGHESKKTEKGVQYTKKLSKGPAEDSPIKESFKDRLLALKNAQRQIQNESKTFDELLEDLNDAQVDKIIYEVLAKDADAGDYIHDFIHSKNPKFAGKSKEMRKKMALGAYYGKHNEEVKDEYARKVDKYLKKKYNKEEVELYEETMKDCYDCGVKEAKKEMKTGIARKSKYEKGTPEYKESLRGYKSVMKNEEVEQIDELSKSTLSSYLDKKKSEYMKGKTQSGSKENAKDIQNMGKAHDKMNKEELIGGQKKIDKNHNGKIDAQDFKILRGQKQQNEGMMDAVKKVGGKVLKTLGHGSDADMMKDLAKKTGVNPPPKTKTEEAGSSEVFTDTLAGRIKGGKPNQHSSTKIKLKAEAVEKDNKPPFDPPYTKAKGNIKDKSGAIHTPMSRARDLAKTAMKKVKSEMMMGKAGGTSE